MFNVGGAEMIFLGLLVLLLFGPQKLPEIARTAGKTLAAFRRTAADVRREMKEALDAEMPPEREPPPPAPPVRERTSPSPESLEEGMRRFPMGAAPPAEEPEAADELDEDVPFEEEDEYEEEDQYEEDEAESEDEARV